MVEHLVIFLEKDKNTLNHATELFEKNGINLIGVSYSNRKDISIIKFLTNQPDKAYETLFRNHITTTRQKVILIKLDNTPNAFHDILFLLTGNKISIDDCYGFKQNDKDEILAVLEVKPYDKALKILEENNIEQLHI